MSRWQKRTSLVPKAPQRVNLAPPVPKERPQADGIRRPPPEGVEQSGRATFPQEARTARPSAPSKPPAARAKLGVAQIPAHCDPYLRWAVLTEWRGFARAGRWGSSSAEDGYVRIIMEVKDPVDFASLKRLVKIPNLYDDDIPGAKQQSRYATGCVHKQHLPALLQQHPDLRWELAAPLKSQDDQPGSEGAYFGKQPDLLPQVTRTVFDGVSPAPVTRGSVSGGAIAVIDFGCPFLHQHLGTAGGQAARVAALWDQGEIRPHAAWAKPEVTGYGRQLDNQALQAMWLASRDPDTEFDEARAYRGLNYLIGYGDPRRRVLFATHGAHVLDMAGGTFDPLTHRDDDQASKARLVFVQLPEGTAGDSSGGSLSAHLLDGLRYVMHVSDPQAPLVINISYGSAAGPHDGSSLIEQAMDELLDARRANFAIVLAAGNSRQGGLHMRRLAAVHRSALFRLNVVAGDSTDTFVEFWYEEPADGDLEFRVRLPGGDWSDWLGADHGVELRDSATEEVVAALVHQRKVPNGRRAMALLALRPTEAPDDDDGSLADAGTWEVEARLSGAGPSAAVAIDAWVERDDPRPFSGLHQTRFIGLEPGDADDTLSSIATGNHTLVVGGFRSSDGTMTSYSSIGPRFKPQMPLTYALCERDSLDAGVRAAAVRSGETLLMNGTSVAAPVMARRVYNLMAQAMQAKGAAPLGWPGLAAELKALAEVRGSVLRIDDMPDRDRPTPGAPAAVVPAVAA